MKRTALVFVVGTVAFAASNYAFAGQNGIDAIRSMELNRTHPAASIPRAGTEVLSTGSIGRGLVRGAVSRPRPTRR